MILRFKHSDMSIAGSLLSRLNGLLSQFSDSGQISQQEIRERLRLLGHPRSVVSKISVALDGSPLPWYTYPAIEYLKSLDLDGMSVFEYGSGYSTLIFEGKGCFVTSVEHDELWFRQISRISKSKNLHLETNINRYVKSISNSLKPRFDIIAIDGIDRERCCRHAIQYLSESGFIILDNSDWSFGAMNFLSKQDLIRIDFSGFGPINNYTWTTSIFAQRSVKLAFLGYPNPVGGISNSQD